MVGRVIKTYQFWKSRYIINLYQVMFVLSNLEAAKSYNILSLTSRDLNKIERQSIYVFTNKYNEKSVYMCQTVINSIGVREGME